jgi:hypothetical protein
MATVNKDFKIKSGLIVEGTTATVNGYDILTKKQDDQDYIIGLIGGAADSAATPDTVVLRDGDANFAANNVTVNTLYVGGTNNNGIDVVDGDTEVGSNNGILLSASNDIALNSSNGDIVLNPDGSAYYGGKSSNNEIATRGYVNGEISSLDTAAQGYADAAETAANGYTDSAISTEVTNRNSAIATAKGEAEDYADTVSGNAYTNATQYTDSAITNLNLAGTYDALGAATTALNDAKSYTDQEVAALVDSAPALLDTLNELAAAIADNPNYATDVANLIADKADTSYVNQEISDLDTAAQGYASAADTSARGYADGLISTEVSDRNSAISTAITNLDLANTYDALGAATTAQNNAATYTDNAINALSTSDIEEGSSLYFTDNRAKTSAADLLTSANLTNITITGTGSGLTITAENGVADSTTSDLVEGSNLYFTAQRAVDALEAVVPNFTAVELNSVAKQVAATTSVPVAGIATGYAWAKADYRSAEFLVKVAYGSHTEISKVLVTLDTSDNIAITEYGIVGTNGSASSVSAGIAGNDVQLQVTTVNNNSTVTVVGTLLA